MPFFGHMNSWCVRQSETTLTHTHTRTDIHKSKTKGSSGQTFCQLWWHFAAVAGRFKPHSALATHTHAHLHMYMSLLLLFVAAWRCCPHSSRNYEANADAYNAACSLSQRTSWSGNAEITDHNIYLFLQFAYKYFSALSITKKLCYVDNFFFNANSQLEQSKNLFKT